MDPTKKAMAHAGLNL